MNETTVKHILYLLVLSLLIGVPWSVMTADRPEPLDLTVGVYQLPPLVHTTRDGEPAGLVIDVLDAIATEENWRINYRSCPWNDCLDHLRDNSIDMLCLIADLPERRHYIEFNQEPVYLDWGQIWTAPENSINSIHDLETQTIAGIENEVFTKGFKTILQSGSIRCNLVEVEGYKDLVELLNDGVVDAVVLNRMFDPSYFEVDLTKTNIIFSPTPMGFGFPINSEKSSMVIQALDKHLVRMKAETDSPYHKALDSWLQRTHTESNSLKYLLMVCVVLLVIVLILFYYRVQRHRRIAPRASVLTETVDPRYSDDANREMTYFKLFNSFNDGLLISDLSVDGVLGGITVCNKQFCLISGRSEEQLKAMRIVDLMPEDVQDRTHVIISQLVGSRDILFKSRIAAPDGLERDVEIHATLIEHADQWKIVAVVRDITDRPDMGGEFRHRLKELENQYEAQNRHLRVVNQELQMFAGTVSHDLQSPLKTIEETLKRIQQKSSRTGEEIEPEMQRMVNQVQKMNRLIRGILEYTRLTRNDIEMVGVGLAQICSEVLIQSDGIVKERNARVKIERPMPRVLAHPNTLVRVVQNLLTNAIKFVEIGKIPEVFLRAEDKGNTVRLWVIDNGIGIAPEYQTRIFEVFQRLHGSEEFPGNGLGLAIVKRAVERMNGKLGLISEVGEGSRFWIELPADPTDP